MSFRQRKSFTLLELAMVLVIIAVLSIVAGNYIRRTRTEAGVSIVLSKLKRMSDAVETYAFDNLGYYPSNMDLLHTIDPPYIDDNYCATSHEGFFFSCTLWSGGYTFTAIPSINGMPLYRVTTGGAMTQNPI